MNTMLENSNGKNENIKNGDPRAKMCNIWNEKFTR